MAETLVKNQNCGACGSDVREHSLFCYHCGGALEAENVSDDSPSDAWFRGEIVENRDVQSKQRAAVKPAKKKEIRDRINKNSDGKVEEVISEEIKSEANSTVNISAKPFKEKEKKKRRRIKTKLTAIDEDTDKNQDISEKVGEAKLEEKPETTEIREVVETKVDRIDTSQPDNSKLKSASALRKRKKPSRIKKVEIVWEERESSPNIWFIVCALILSAIVGGLVFLSFYLK